MLIVIRQVLAALFRIDLIALAIKTNRKGIASVFDVFVGFVAHVLQAGRRRALGIGTCHDTKKQADTGTEEHERLTKTKGAGSGFHRGLVRG